jgi:SAM-dependent methyltransferase
MNQVKSSTFPCGASRLARFVMLVLVGMGVGLPDGEVGKTPLITLQASEIVGLAKSLSPVAGSYDSYPSISRLVFGAEITEPGPLTAFEENQFFIYSLGKLNLSGGSSLDSREAGRALSVTRRFIVLRPSVFVVDDRVEAPGPRAEVEWRMYSRSAPELAGRAVRVADSGGELYCETLLPRDTLVRTGRDSASGPGAGAYWVEEVSQGELSPGRFLHVLGVWPATAAHPQMHAEVSEREGKGLVTVTTRDRIFQLTLPPPDQEAGDISISRANGKTLLQNRLFPSGVLPHGGEGVRVMEQWDADYRGKSPPLWDIGRPSNDLKKLVEDGTLRPCRAVDLCCGTGTDAIYLARRGFDVTAIDVSPTALTLARKKAQAAHVTVRWMLADILAPPSLAPFDFLYDRGCYHVVRDQNLAAYLETIRRISRPGSQFLLLAARRDAQGGGLVGVTEEELGYDFFSLFDVEWLRESRLESTRPDVNPPSWSALLRRKPGT